MRFTLAPLDIVIIIAIFQLTLFIFFLAFTSRKRLSNIFLAVFLFSQLIMLLTALSIQFYSYFYAHFPHFFYLSLPFFTLVSPVLYFFVKCLADADFTLTKKQFLHFLPFVVVFLYFTFAFYLYPASTKRTLLDNHKVVSQSFLDVYRAVYYCQILTYNIASLKIIADYRLRIKQQFSSLDRINLSWLKVVIYGFICAWFVDVIQFFTARFNLHVPVDLRFLDFTAFFIFFNVIFFKGLTHPQIFSLDTKAKYQSSTLSKTRAVEYLRTLKSHMKREKSFLKPDISLKDLAEELDIPPRYLSQVINEHHKQNFYDFITTYRIEEAKRRLTSPSRKTVLEIMYEVGFNSKSSFNQSFKKLTGMTPSQFKRELSHKRYPSS
jgi:AraC-like DNA-binding protein